VSLQRGPLGGDRLELTHPRGAGPHPKYCGPVRLRNRNLPAGDSAEFLLLAMKLFQSFCVFTYERSSKLLRRRMIMMTTVSKQPPLVEDLRSHSPEQVGELRRLLSMGAPSRPDPRRPGFFEIEGPTNVFYVFKYPTGSKVLLLGVWEKDQDPVAELVACSRPAA
jgi:hypothetical protein